MEQDVIKSVVRPETYGDLYELLKKGIKCECQTYCVINVVILIDIISDLRGEGKIEYKMYPSSTNGWTIFEKI